MLMKYTYLVDSEKVTFVYGNEYILGVNNSK